jgi:drug/metabolite transporter (DMT)-like permease
MTTATTPSVTPAIGLCAALTTVLLWASAFPVVRLALKSFDPVPLAALRFAIATPWWLAWFFWRNPQRPSRPALARFLICGLVGIALYNVLLNSGQLTIPAGAASFIVNTVPVITAILAVLFLGEPFRGWAWGGTALSFGGVVLIASSQPGGLSFGAGAMLVFGAACCQAVFFVLQRPLVGAYGAKTCATFVIVFGALCLSPWLPQALVQAQVASPQGLASVLYLGVAPAAIGYATWSVAQGYYGASRAANFLYLVPPVAVALAFLLVAETPSVVTVVGGMVAIAGVVIVNTWGRA